MTETDHQLKAEIVNGMQKHPEKKHAHDARYQFAGWILFIVCAVCYIVSSLIHLKPLLKAI